MSRRIRGRGQGKTMKRFCGIVAAGLVLSTYGVPVEARADEPLRSGTILVGNPFLMGPPSCTSTPDCAAWWASGCDARLSGIDPVASTSIIDVGKLAGSTRRLRLDGLAVGWLDSLYEFWSDDCRRVGAMNVKYPSTSVSIPRDARWMTAPAPLGPYHWELW